MEEINEKTWEYVESWLNNEKTNKRFSLSIFKYWGTPSKKFIGGVDVDGFDNLIIVIKYLMDKELDPLIMNCGTIEDIKFNASDALEKIRIYETNSNLSKNQQ